MDKEKNSSNKCPICGRPTHKESKYCIFHASAEEKTEREFIQKLKYYVEDIKRKDEVYDFRYFVFVGGIDFKKDLGINAFKEVDFYKATFNKYVKFIEVTFEEKANFDETIFEDEVAFTNAIFEDEVAFTNAKFNLNTYYFYEGASFSSVTFNGETFFKFATFNGEVDFFSATFNGEVDFFSATFEEEASFIKTTFNGKVSFESAIFNWVAHFNSATFNGKVSFESAILNCNIYFNEATFNGEANFLRATFNGETDFYNSILGRIRIKKEQIENHILSEKNKDFLSAKENYLLFKNYFHSIGRYEDESWAFKKEKDMERKSYYSNIFTKNTEKKEEKNQEKDQNVKKSKAISYSNWMKAKEFGKWLWSCFCNAIYGYGEKPKNVIISAGIIIIFFALLFSSIGISNPEIIDLKGITVDQNTGNIVDSASKGLLKNNIIRNIPDSLYFSLITFTTLGYGDFRPLEGWGRILAGSEAFIGAFMMALFVYTFARRTGGR